VCIAPVRENITAVIGETVTLPCWTHLATPVDWYYLPSENAERGRFICSAGNIVGGHIGRFTLVRNVPGDYSLVIHNLTLEEAGVYLCREDVGLGREHRITLTVRGKMSNTLYI